MKILITTGIYPPSIGGPATYSKLLFDELPKLGFEVKVLSFDSVRKYPKGISHLFFLFKTIKTGIWADVLYSQDTVSVGLPTCIASFILRKKLFIRVPGDHVWEQGVSRFGVTEDLDDFPVNVSKYGIYMKLLRKIQFGVVRSASTVIVPSFYFKKIVDKWVKDTEKVRVIYNGIDFKDFKNIEEINVDKNKIITAGRLVPWKEFELLIDLFKDEDLKDFKLHIVGDGPLKEKLQEKIKVNNLRERVFLRGRLNREDLIKEIKNSGIFILNSSFESFSFQVVESMAIGTPVLASNVCNIPEIIEDREDGLLFDFGDSDKIKSCIKEVSEDSDFRNKLVNNAKEKVREFSIENTLNNLSELLKK